MGVSCEGPVWGRQGQEAAERPPLPPLGPRGCTPSRFLLCPTRAHHATLKHPRAPGPPPLSRRPLQVLPCASRPFLRKARKAEKEKQQQRQEARGPEFTQKMKGGLHTRPGERKPSVSAKTWSNLESVTTGQEILTISRKCLEV